MTAYREQRLPPSAAATLCAKKLFMNPYQQFDSELSACRRCAAVLATVPVDPAVSAVCVEPRPIVSGIRPKPILLIGQAPGITEYEAGRPFQGSAGQKIRGIFHGLGVVDFDDLVYSSAVVKCFPGRKLRPSGGSEDRVPCRAMVRSCRPFLERQIELVQPQVIVTLGSFPLRAYLELSHRADSRPKLEKYVGTSQEWGGRAVVFFPHTSGGARWLNSSENRELFESAKKLLRAALIERKVVL